MSKSWPLLVIASILLRKIILLQNWNVWLWSGQWKNRVSIWKAISSRTMLRFCGFLKPHHWAWLLWLGLLDSRNLPLLLNSGKENKTLPDAPSRAPTGHTASLPICGNVTSSSVPSEELPIPVEAVWNAQQEHSLCQAIYHKIIDDGKLVINPTNSYTVFEDLIYQVTTLLLKTLYQFFKPSSFGLQLLEYFNKNPLSGHFGQHKTYWRLKNFVYWLQISWHVCKR